MRILSVTGVVAVAMLASGVASEASAQGRGRGQNQSRATGLVRARQVASVNSRLLRAQSSRVGRINDDGDSDSDGNRKIKHKNKHKGKNKSCKGNGDVIGQSGTTLPSGVCVDANGDGMCDSGTGADQRRTRTRTGTSNGGVILGRRTPGNILVQQVGLALLQRYAYQQALVNQQRIAYGQRGIR